MSRQQLEAAVLRELRIVANNPRLRQQDIMEWSTGPVTTEPGETAYWLPDLRVNVAVKVQ